MSLRRHLRPAGRLGHALLVYWPHYATYVVSFLTIGIIWMNHHAQFDRIDHADRTLMVLNLILLMFVTLIPFPTSLLATYLHAGTDEHVAAAVYAGTLLAMSIAFFSTYLWAAHRRLFAAWVGEQHVGYLVRRTRRAAGLRRRDRRGLRQRLGQPRALRPGRSVLPPSRAPRGGVSLSRAGRPPPPI